jgi:hypothetical protein
VFLIRLITIEKKEYKKTALFGLREPPSPGKSVLRFAFSWEEAKGLSSMVWNEVYSSTGLSFN